MLRGKVENKHTYFKNLINSTENCKKKLITKYINMLIKKLGTEMAPTLFTHL